MARTVLVTGVSRYLGGRLATILSQDESLSVIGVDVIPPAEAIPGISFVRADIRNPVIGRIMVDAEVDTVVHMGVISTPREAGGRAAMKEINVIGTMQLLAACERTPSLSSLVVKSTSAVYGSGPRDPAKFTEDMNPSHVPTSGWAKDSVEVEGYVRGFGRRRPDVCVTTLRFANAIGPVVQTSMSAYLSMPVVPTVLGFDPRIQFVHEDDLVESIRLSIEQPTHGTFNIAGDGVMLLSQAIRRLGRRQAVVPAPIFTMVARRLMGRGTADFTPENVRYLSYGRSLDTRAMRETLGFEPDWTTSQALDSFAESRSHVA